MSPHARLCRNALLTWLVLFALAFLNGALREFVLVPLAGAAALPLSGLTAIVLFGVAIARFVHHAQPGIRDAVAIGLGWLVLTIVAEAALIAASRTPAVGFADLFAWRTIAAGNLFVVLLAEVTLAPVLFAWKRRR